MARGNQIFWRIAAWTWGLSHVDQQYDNELYDKAAVLYAKVIGNDFTGPDLHKD